MANNIFFLSWELWQQMTFVLAGAIVVVFLAGLVKLWWINRLMKKQEILDEEKRARMQEMGRTGIPAKRVNDIPFGVRAIQKGVEVDGIWVSRPASPNDATTDKAAVSATTFEALDRDSQRKKKELSEDPKSAATSGTKSQRATPRYSSAKGIVPHRLDHPDFAGSTPAATPPISRFSMYNTGQQNSRGASVLNEDTLRRLEGQARSRPVYDTYRPTSNPRNQQQRSQRSSASSSGESVDYSQPRSARSVSGKSYASSHSSRLYMSRHPHESNSRAAGAGYDVAPQAWTAERDIRDPFETPGRTPSGLTTYSQSEATPSSLAQSQDLLLSMPEPTFGPGDMHVNRSSRRVNDGFEVLPAGTFGTSHELGGFPHSATDKPTSSKRQ
ncbi:hypothetical protein B0T17DRAFT_499066 [Bombardia bombarda]|uniref:Uncharacterized protein n=1 Tax=Bombardia bombarda TaxID=252184 RepID=A0AA39U6M5_9PEZI|nr:hypothetical protein B0T17DRAFT_499066 [Bombardia bombarda]